MPSLLLCSDLDGTLIPDGRMPEPAGARAQFRRYVAEHDIRVIYATGRTVEHADAGIVCADLPLGWALIADAGASLYYRGQWGWEPWLEYTEQIKPAWERLDIIARVGDVSGLTPQEDERQAEFKVSFYATHHHVRDVVAERLANVECTELWSGNCFDGWLLDILPVKASKRHALQFAAETLDGPSIVFAGNDGNDLPILGSEIPSVLVANAHPMISTAALANAEASGHKDRLYLAQQGYAAGVVEGAIHFWGAA